MPLPSRKKTTKEKIQEIKDLVSGKKTIDSFVIRPGGGMVFVYNAEPGVYRVHEGGQPKTMTQEQYDEWYAAKKEGIDDHIIGLIVFNNQSGNDPLIDVEDYADYVGKQPVKEQQPNVLISPIGPPVILNEPQSVAVNKAKERVKKEKVKKEVKDNDAAVSLGGFYEEPAVKTGHGVTERRIRINLDSVQELNMYGHSSFVQSVKNLFNNP